MHHHFGNLCVVEGVQCNEMHEEQEAGSRAYMMNEKSKSLGKPGVKSGGAKKNISHVAEVGKWGWFHFLQSWQMSGTACKGLEGKCSCKMQKFCLETLISSV